METMTKKIVNFKPEMEKLISADTEIETVAEGFIFTEGPVWDAKNQALLFSDIPGDTIYKWSSKAGTSVYRKPSHFSNGLTYHPNGFLVSCEHRGRCISMENEKGEAIPLATHFDGKRLNSPNDVITSSDGSIIFSDPIYGLQEGLGGPADAELDFQGVYRFDPADNSLTLLVDDFERPNGLMLSDDEKWLFINDTPRQHIRVFEVSESWQLKNGRIWVELWDKECIGRPDGMKLDISGNVFCTGPGGVWIFNPNAELLGRIYLPDKTANLAWGDADYQSLFITSSTFVYRIRCITHGKPLLKW